MKWRVFPFLSRYNTTMSAGLIKIGSGLISSRRTTPIACHTFYARLFLHMLFGTIFPMLKAQKTQPLSNSIQLGAFARSTTFDLSSFFHRKISPIFKKTVFTGCELLHRKLITKANPQVLKLVLVKARVTPFFFFLKF